MKKYTIKNIRNLFINLLLIATTILSISSCNDDFLEELPKDQYTDKTAFISYENFKTYAWSLYNVFSAGSHLQRISDFGSTICRRYRSELSLSA